MSLSELSISLHFALSFSIILYGLFFVVWDTLNHANFSASFRYALKCYGFVLFVYGGLYIPYSLLSRHYDHNFTLESSINLSRFFFLALTLYEILRAFLNVDYPIKRRFKYAVLNWAIFTAVEMLNAYFVPEIYHTYTMALITIAFFLIVGRFIYKFFIAYGDAVQKGDDYLTYSLELFIKWIRNGVYYLSFIGLVGGAISITQMYNVLLYQVLGWTFFSYMSFSLLNFCISLIKSDKTEVNEHIYDLSIALEKSDNNIETKQQHESDNSNPNAEVENNLQENYDSQLDEHVNRWIATKDYTSQDLTVVYLAKLFGVNRTYLSSYIKSKFGMSFREWVSQLRLEYSKELLITYPHLPANKIGPMVGYSPNRYVVVFTEANKMSPGQWRKKYFDSRTQ